MTMLYYPENIRRFVGELTFGKPEISASQTDTVPFECVDPPFPAETAFLAFLDYSHDAGKGVEMVPAATIFTAEIIEQ